MLVHNLAGKHNLGHRSQGKGDQRFITVFKRARGGVSEAEIARHYDSVSGMGYSQHNRGVGLGFAARAHNVAPPKSLVRLARLDLQATRVTVAVCVAVVACNGRWCNGSRV